jgi:hypothetical protein
MNYVTVTLVAVVSALTLTACGSKVPQDIVDNNMTISRLNAQKNANSYLSTVYPDGVVNAQYGKPFRIMMQSDSSINETCRYGDGWASGEIQFPAGNTVKVKCQTNGTGKGINGCLTDAEYATKVYKNEDGSCQNLASMEKFK